MVSNIQENDKGSYSWASSDGVSIASAVTLRLVADGRGKSF